MTNKSKKILSEISPGELLDKISILEIKLEKVKDKNYQKEIKKEYKNIQGIIFLQKFRPVVKSKNDLALELRVSVESTKIIIEFFKDMFVENSSKSIVVIGSIASKFVAQEQSIDYHIAKSALVGLVNYYAVSLASKGIHINMLSPSTKATSESPMNSSPNMNACASPSGDGCTLYEKFIPISEPSHKRSLNLGKSVGVEIISTSVIPASIRTESG